MHEHVPDDAASYNADALDRALAKRRLELETVEDGDVRDRHAHAVAFMERYTHLLREPGASFGPQHLVAFCFKLVFPDGRWDVDEKQLVERPRKGDVVSFDEYGEWRVEGTQCVLPRPSGKPAREILVCAPAA